jgi:capsular polysaccharide biosynthesis protein
MDLPVTDPGDSIHVPRVAAVELPGARVLGPHRAVVTGRGDLLNELSGYFGTSRAREHPLFLNPFPQPPLEVPGRLGVLASRGDGNYYHFLHDVLPRLGVLQQCPQIAAPQRWYVPVRTRFQRELLDLVGIGPDQRIDADEHPHVRAECLVVPGLPATTEKNAPWVGGFLRGRLLDASLADAPRRRIYVTRGPSANNRTVINDVEVQELLGSRGFELVDPGELSVREQIETFATASVIVATHGAALANLVFAPFGTAVVELFPAGCLLPDYWRMACGVPGMRYRYLSAPGGPTHPTRASTIVRDIEVDLAALRAMLDDLIP